MISAEARTGHIDYESITPPNRHLYARQVLAGTTVAMISAELLMPKEITAGPKVPAVVLSHGSGGTVSNRYDVWAKELNAAGYAVLIPDSYKPRGVMETNSNQELMPYCAHVAGTKSSERFKFFSSRLPFSDAIKRCADHGK